MATIYLDVYRPTEDGEEENFVGQIDSRVLDTCKKEIERSMARCDANLTTMLLSGATGQKVTDQANRKKRLGEAFKAIVTIQAQMRQER